MLLRHGESATITFADLHRAADLPHPLGTFVDGDRLWFDVKESDDALGSLLAASTDAGTIEFTPDTPAGSVTIDPAQWADVDPKITDAVFVLRRTHANETGLVLAGTVTIAPPDEAE